MMWWIISGLGERTDALLDAQKHNCWRWAWRAAQVPVCVDRTGDFCKDNLPHSRQILAAMSGMGFGTFKDWLQSQSLRPDLCLTRANCQSYDSSAGYTQHEMDWSNMKFKEMTPLPTFLLVLPIPCYPSSVGQKPNTVTQSPILYQSFHALLSSPTLPFGSHSTGIGIHVLLSAHNGRPRGRVAHPSTSDPRASGAASGVSEQYKLPFMLPRRPFMF